MYEPKPHPPIPRRRFVRRLLLHIAAALALFLVSLLPGMAGYAYFEHLPWRDAGLVFLVGAGLIFAPVVHRVMHKFHWEQEPQRR